MVIIFTVEKKLNGFLINHGLSPIKPSAIHSTDDFEIFILISGNSNYYLNSTLYALTAGCIVFSCPGDLKWNVYTSSEYERYTVNLPISFIPKDVMPLLLSIFNRKFLQADPEWLKELFDTIKNEYEQPSAINDIVIKNLLIHFFITLSRNNNTNTEPSLNQAHPAVVMLIDYVNSHYTKPITFEDAVRMTNLNRSYLSKLFHNSTGMPFKKYVMFIRIEHSKQLLRLKPNISISKVSEQCGFSDSNYFSKVFSRLVGCSPIEYKKYYSKK